MNRKQMSQLLFNVFLDSETCKRDSEKTNVLYVHIALLMQAVGH